MNFLKALFIIAVSLGICNALICDVAERTRKECMDAYANWVWYPEKRKPIEPGQIEGCEVIRNARWEDEEVD